MRWADADLHGLYGHLNNAVHYQLFDSGVATLLLRKRLLDLGASLCVFMMVQPNLGYFAERRFTDTL